MYSKTLGSIPTGPGDRGCFQCLAGPGNEMREMKKAAEHTALFRDDSSLC